MGNKFKDLDIKMVDAIYFFNGKIILKILIERKSRQMKSHIKIYYIGYVMVKDLRYIKIENLISVNLLINKINGYIEEDNGTKYLMLVLAVESKDTKKV